MKDFVYCSNGNCPFEDCQNHLKNLSDRNQKEMIRVAGLDGVCRRYIGLIVEKMTEDQVGAFSAN